MARKPEILILDDDDELDENNDFMDCNNMYLGEEVTLVTLMNEIADIKATQSIMQQDILTIRTNMQNQWQKMNTTLGKILTLLQNDGRTVQSVDEPANGVKDEPNNSDEFNVCEDDEDIDPMLSFQFPVRSAEDIQRLNDLILNEATFRQQLVAKLSTFSGMSGQLDGLKVAYRLADAVFDPYLLQEYTWTGVSRGPLPNTTKKPFQTMFGIVDVFFEILHMADTRYTKQKTEDFFKMILKHSKKRAQRKRIQQFDVFNWTSADRNQIDW